MNIEVSSDTTSRVVIFKLSEADPLLHRPYGWRESQERHFVADTAVVKIQDGQKLSIMLAGPMILKGGKLSENTRCKATWSWREMDERHTDAPPAWVLGIWRSVQ